MIKQKLTSKTKMVEILITKEIKEILDLLLETKYKNSYSEIIKMLLVDSAIYRFQKKKIEKLIMEHKMKEKEIRYIG